MTNQNILDRIALVGHNPILGGKNLVGQAFLNHIGWFSETHFEPMHTHKRMDRPFMPFDRMRLASLVAIVFAAVLERPQYLSN